MSPQENDNGLSPTAEFTRDLLRAHQKAQEARVPIESCARIAAGFAEDLADLANDSQWPDTLLTTIDEARAQLAARKEGGAA